MKRPHHPPEELAILRGKLTQCLREDRPVKAFALEHGISKSHIYTMVKGLGWKMHYTSNDEFRMLLATRRAKIIKVQ